MSETRDNERKGTTMTTEPTADSRTGEQVIAEARATLAEAERVIATNSKTVIPKRSLDELSVIGRTPDEVAELVYGYVEAVTTQHLRAPNATAELVKVGLDHFRRLAVHHVAKSLDAWRKDA